MNDHSEYRPRLSIDVSMEQKQELDRLLGHTHGLKKAVFLAIVEDLITILRSKHGALVLSGIITRQVRLQDFLRIDDEAAAAIRGLPPDS